MSEEVNKEFDEAIEDVLGGTSVDEDHSPAPEDDAKESLEVNENAVPDETDETFEPYGDEEDAVDTDSTQDEGVEGKSEGTPGKTDSVPEEKETAPDAGKDALQNEITNYQKRLHDAQAAMHKANEERAKLQKELDELKKKLEPSDGAEEASDADDDGDNWFADEKTDNKSAELEGKIKAIEEKQEEFQRDQAIQNWKKEAESFAKEHEDFNTLVYEKLEPLLDEESGDPAVLAAYIRWGDKSPAGAYKFAKKFFSIEENLSGSPQKQEQEAKASIDPTKGKAGLDRINSADFSEPKRHSGNMIDDVFG